MGQVPVLSQGDMNLAQSMAILEYLEELCPAPALLPKDIIQRAMVRQLAETINSGTQPLQNLRALRHLRQHHNQSEEDTKKWAAHWIQIGLEAFQRSCDKVSGRYSLGDDVTFADLCLVPQLYNARRFGTPMDAFAQLTRIEARLNELAAFQAAHPDQQPDAP